MNNEEDPRDESLIAREAASKDTQCGQMIVGVTNRLAGVFTRDEEQYDLPENFKPRNDDYDWLGVD